MIFIKITYGLQRSYFAPSNSKVFDYVPCKEPAVLNFMYDEQNYMCICILQRSWFFIFLGQQFR